MEGPTCGDFFLVSANVTKIRNFAESMRQRKRLEHTRNTQGTHKRGGNTMLHLIFPLNTFFLANNVVSAHNVCVQTESSYVFSMTMQSWGPKNPLGNTVSFPSRPAIGPLNSSCEGDHHESHAQRLFRSEHGSREPTTNPQRTHNEPTMNPQ